MRIVSSVLLGGALFAAIAGCKAEPPQSPPPDLAAPPSPSAAATTTSAPTVATTSAPPAPEKETCASDGDCVLSNFVACCSCCPCGPLHATTAAHEARTKAVCAAEACPSCASFVGDCVACPDPAKEGMRARCIDATCTLVETKASAPPPAAPTCKTDDDCWLDDAHAPIARPAKLRGKKIRPCKDGEHVPACTAGACIVRAYKC